MENVEYYLEGFLKQAEYSFHFHNFFKMLEVLTPLQKVEIYLKQEPVIGNYKPTGVTYEFSSDGKYAKIVVPFQLHSLKSGKMSQPPAPQDVFETLSRVLKNADEQYKREHPSGSI